MPRQKKPQYEYVPKLKLYRKRIKDTDGRYFPLYGKTPDELTAKIEAAKAEIAAGLEARENPTVRQYAEQWLARETPLMGYKYAESTTGAINLHVLPIIGDLRLREVTYDDTKDVMAAMVGRSSSLHSKVLSSMRRMFESARKSKIIAENPCDDLTAGGKPAQKKVSLTAPQKETLLEAVEGTKAETFVKLALYAGLRREEALGLLWSNIVLEGDTPHLHVRTALRWEHNRPVVSEILKTDAAWRSIPLPPQLADHLRGIKPKEIPANAPHVVGGKPATESTFRNLWRYVTDRQTGPKTYKDPGTKEFVTFMRELGAKSRGGDFCYTIDFDVAPHILRHTYITDLILSGANLRRVQYLAGHSNIKVTLEIYTHLMEHAPENLMPEVMLAFGVKSEAKNTEDAKKSSNTNR